MRQKNRNAALVGKIYIGMEGEVPHSRAQGRRDSSEGGCGSRVGGETRGYRGRIKSRSRDRGGDRYERNLVDRDSRDNKK